MSELKFGIEEVVSLYENLWEVKDIFRRRGYKKMLKGYCHHEPPLIEIYINSIENKLDYQETLVHEGIHAFYPDLKEEEVDYFSKIIIKDSSEIADFMIDIFNLKNKHI